MLTIKHDCYNKYLNSLPKYSIYYVVQAKNVIWLYLIHASNSHGNIVIEAHAMVQKSKITLFSGIIWNLQWSVNVTFQSNGIDYVNTFVQNITL